MTPHDTREAVEAMAKWLSDDDMHWPAAMLRRLLARAEAAEAALATARADALREAATTAFIAASTSKEGRPVRDAILALIEKEPRA